MLRRLFHLFSTPLPLAHLPRPLSPDDLRLSPTKAQALRQLSPLQRQALSDECDIIVLTSLTPESRDAAQRLKDHLMALTADPVEVKARRAADLQQYLPKAFRR